MLKRKSILVVVLFALAVVLAGCQYSGASYGGRTLDDAPVITLKDYVEGLRAAATRKPTQDEIELFSDVPELSASMTTHFVKREFQVVYMDADYVSFRADMEDCHGGNGNHSRVFVGTIDRGTGRILAVADLVPKEKWPTLKQRLRAGAAQAVGGVKNLQDEVEITENFHYAKDGLHFVYNPYVIACGAAGAVEVVVDYKKL